MSGLEKLSLEDGWGGFEFSAGHNFSRNDEFSCRNETTVGREEKSKLFKETIE